MQDETSSKKTEQALSKFECDRGDVELDAAEACEWADLGELDFFVGVEVLIPGGFGFCGGAGVGLGGGPGQGLGFV